MVKQKKGPKYNPNKAAPKTLSVFEQGFEFFSKGKYTQAVNAWEKLPADHPERANALGEAYFRRYLAEQAESDLETARSLLPQEPRIMYQVGLLRHRQGRLEEAIQAYAQAMQAGLSTRRAQTVRVLAEIEHAPHSAPQVLAPLNDVERVRLLPAAYLLQNRSQALIDWQLPDLLDAQEKLLKQEPALLRLWKGLAEFSTQQFAQAAATLAPITKGQPLPADANSVRAYYYALALAHSGQEIEALSVLEQAVQRAHFSAMSEGLAILVIRRTHLAIQEGSDDAIPLLERALKVAPNESRLAALLITRLANRAEQAARGNAWRAALADWLRMEGLIQLAPENETTGIIVHNLAIAYERLEDWENAALRWNEVINLLPRRQTNNPSKRFSSGARLANMPVNEAKDWLRKRIIFCYQKAGQPERAVDVYRKAVKQDPADLPLRMGLVNALVANDQWLAAENELGRIIEQEPTHIPARLTLAHIIRETNSWMARKLLTEALEIDPNNESVRKELSDLLLELGEQMMVWKRDKAHELITEAAKIMPDHPRILAKLGESYVNMEQEEQAQQVFERVLAAGTVEAFGSVFTVYLNLDRVEPARATLERYKTSHSSEEQLTLMLGAGLLLAEKLALMKPSHPQVSAWKVLTRDVLDSLFDSQTIKERAEFLPEIIMKLASYVPDLALEYVHKLNAIIPDHPRFLSILALVQAIMEDIKAAKETLKRAEKLARQQKDTEILETIRSLREELDSPFGPMIGPMLRMRMALDDEDIDDMDDMMDNFLSFDEDEEDLL